MLGMKNDLAACIKKPEVELIELLRDGDRHAKVANGQRDQAVNDNVLVRASDEMRDMGHAGKAGVRQISMICGPARSFKGSRLTSMRKGLGSSSHA